MVIANITKSIGKWLMPYKYVFEEEEIVQHSSKKKRKKQNFKGRLRNKLTIEEEKEKKEFLNSGAIGINIVSLSEQLKTEEVLTRLSRSKYNVGYYNHDDHTHQLAIKFEKGSAWKFYQRNSGKIKSLNPMLGHKSKIGTDKTHVIPLGYHGSENDERLIVGYSSKINRGPLKKAEDYIANINHTENILWFVDIEKQKDLSAIWNMTVWDEAHNIILKESFFDKGPFYWS